MLGLGSATRTFLSYGALLAALAATPACTVKYRHEVEKPGTAPRYTHSAGGFMRYDGYDDVAGDMEIASREYEKPGTGSRIRLVGVIHIGDLDYYQTLQKEELDTSDVVLFEGVKFEGLDEEELAKRTPDLGGLYGAMGQLLGTGFQKDGIDYKAKNFVHCDVTVKEGDPLFQQVDPDQIRQASQMVQPLVMMKTMLSAGGDARRTEDALKHGMVTMMSLQMQGLDEKAAAEKAAEQLGGKRGESDPLRKRAEEAMKELKKLGPVLPGMNEGMMQEILVKRNEYVLDRLGERLAADGDAKKQTIAVFYGAAHMPGMEERLLEWGYRPVETRWYKAWRMNGRGQSIASERQAGSGDTPVASGKKPAEKTPSGERPRQPAPSRKKEPTLF